MNDAGAAVPAQSITASLRDLYSFMDKGSNVPPVVLLQTLHVAFPRFAEKNTHGGFAQQVYILYRCFGFLKLLNFRMQMNVGLN